MSASTNDSTTADGEPLGDVEESAPRDEPTEQGDAESDDGSGSERPEPDLSLDTTFEILRNERRRRVLKYLRENEGEGTLSDLAEHIAAIENDTTPQALAAQERKRVYIGLYQCHLPKMDGTGIVEFDQHRGTVERTDAADELDVYLRDDDASDASRRFPRYYLGTATGGAATYVGASLLNAPAALLLGIVLLLSAATAAIALVDRHRQRLDE